MSTIQKQRIKLNMERMKKMHKDRMASLKDRLASMSDTKKEEKELVSTYLESKHKKDKEKDGEEFLLGKDAEKIERMRQQQSKVMELNKYTLAQYQNKAAGDLAMKAMDQGSGLKDRSTDANKRKIQKRMVGIGKAARKLSGGGYTGGVGPESPTGKMHNEDVDEGVLGALGGGIVGGMVGGPLGALAGAYGGHKIQQQRNKIKKLQKRALKAEEDQVDEVSRETLGSYVSKASDASKHRGLPTKKVDNRYSGVAKASKRLDKMEKGSVNEVSKKTLASYVDRAASSLMRNAHSTGMRDGSGRDPIGSVAIAKRDKEVRNVVNRRAGIKGAAKRLSKEEVDQVDELNVRTMRSYKDKAAGDIEDRVAAGHTTPTDKTKKRMQGIGRASDKIQTAKIKQRQRMGVSELKTSTLKSYLGKVKDKHSDMLNPHVDDYEPHKVDQERSSGYVYKGDEIARAKAKLAKRGVNELKTPTLKRYLSKADDSLTDMGQDMKSATSKFNKRRLGMAKAQGRLSMNRQLGRAEESVQEDAELKKVASELEGASKKHLKQAQKVKAHVDKMGEENMNGLSIEQVYARQVAKQLLKMDEDMHDVDDSLPKDAKKKVMNGKDKYKGLDKANGDDDKDAVTSEGLSAKQKKLPPGLQKAIAAKAAKNEEVDEGVLGAVGGGIVGGMAGGPVGAALGAYAGHKMQQQKNKIKKLQKPKNEEVKVTQVPENEKHTAKMKKAAKMYKTVPASQRGTGSAGKRGGDSGFKAVKMGEEVDQLLDVTDIENLIVEDGHADVASARRKAALMVEDALQILMKLREMEPTDSMPSWWMNKMAVSSSMIDSARNYIVVPSMDQQPEIPEEVRLTDQEAEELAEGAIGATLGGIGGAALTGGPIGAGVGAVVGHKVEKGVRSVGRRIKQGYQAFKQKPKMEATDHKAAAKMIAKKAVSNAVKDLTNEAGMMIITPMMKRKKVQQDVAAAGGLPTQSATSESVVQKYLKRD